MHARLLATANQDASQNSKRLGKNGNKGRRRKTISGRLTRNGNDSKMAAVLKTSRPTPTSHRAPASHLVAIALNYHHPSDTALAVVRYLHNTAAVSTRCIKLATTVRSILDITHTRPMGRANRCRHDSLHML